MLLLQITIISVHLIDSKTIISIRIITNISLDNRGKQKHVNVNATVFAAHLLTMK